MNSETEVSAEQHKMHGQEQKASDVNIRNIPDKFHFCSEFRARKSKI